MHRQMSYYIFSIVILLICISPSVYGVTCSYSQTTCYSSSYATWCCPSYQRCGSYYLSCYTSTSSTPLSAALGIVLVIIILISFCICFVCIRSCARSQQQARANMYNTNPQIVSYSYQQQPMSGPPRVVPARPIYNVNAAPQIHNIYEAPPPSYDDATAKISPQYPSASPTSSTATIGERNFRI